VVAIGALDMAVWDAAAKIGGLSLSRFLARRLGREAVVESQVRVYAAGGYVYPRDDVARLSEEVRRFVELGFTHAKIKIGSAGLVRDQKRIEAAAAQLPGAAAHLAVDAIYAYDAETGPAVASMLAPFGLWWFEDICDPLDFETLAGLVATYQGPIAAGEALFSLAEAKLLDRYGGLRRERDILLFDPVHCYGLPGFVQIVDYLAARGWLRRAFWPHGGHLFCLHLVAALGLRGAEVNPLGFQPLCGLTDGAEVVAEYTDLPQAPGIGFEMHSGAYQAFRALMAG
jgi:D(-)-tartrate dehydratase